MTIAAAADFGFVIAGEKSLACQRIGREIAFKEGTRIAADPSANLLPIRCGAGIIGNGFGGRLFAEDGATAAKCSQRRIEIRFAPAGKIGKTCRRQKRGGAAQPPPAKRGQQQDPEKRDDKPAAQGSAPLVATNVQVGLAAPIWRAKVQTSVTSRWT